MSLSFGRCHSRSLYGTAFTARTRIKSHVLCVLLTPFAIWWLNKSIIAFYHCTEIDLQIKLGNRLKSATSIWYKI